MVAFTACRWCPTRVHRSSISCLAAAKPSLQSKQHASWRWRKYRQADQNNNILGHLRANGTPLFSDESRLNNAHLFRAAEPVTPCAAPQHLSLWNEDSFGIATAVTHMLCAYVNLVHSDCPKILPKFHKPVCHAAEPSKGFNSKLQHTYANVPSTPFCTWYFTQQLLVLIS